MRITVKYAEPIDALGRKKPGWYVMDGNQFCGRYDDKEKAEREAEALRHIRHTSR